MTKNRAVVVVVGGRGVAVAGGGGKVGVAVAVWLGVGVGVIVDVGVGVMVGLDVAVLARVGVEATGRVAVGKIRGVIWAMGCAGRGVDRRSSVTSRIKISREAINSITTTSHIHQAGWLGLGCAGRSINGKFSGGFSPPLGGWGVKLI